MGQPITVTRKRTAVPGVVRFEINRSLTGMGFERYRSAADAAGSRPPDVLARRLFEHGGIDAISIYSNMITIDVSKGFDGEGLQQVIEDLFIHYTEGVQPSIP